MAPSTDMAIRFNSSTDVYRVPQAKQKIEQDTQIKPDVQEQASLQKEEQKTQPRELTAAVEEMNKRAHGLQRSLQFSIEQDLNLTVVKVINPNTDEVVRQLPSEEFIAIAKAFDETNSLLFDAKV